MFRRRQSRHRLCDSPSASRAGRALEAASDFTFLLLLLLCAKGYTITRGRLRQASAIKLTIFLALYVATWGVLFVYEQVVSLPASRRGGLGW